MRSILCEVNPVFNFVKVALISCAAYNMERQVHPLQAAYRKLQKNRRQRKDQLTQGEGAEVIGLYYRKLLHRVKVSYWITARIWKNYT